MSGQATRTYQRRLALEYKAIKKNPPPFINAEPLPENILEWHYVIYGLGDDCPYHEGFYHGKLVFPREYPMKPPSIYMITPNGRFKVNTRLCLSMSDFHPDSWNPAWSVESILKGLLSFMLEQTPTSGSMTSTTPEKRRFAKQSLLFNLRDDVFCSLFPEEASQIRKILREKRAEMKEHEQESHPDQTSKDSDELEVSSMFMFVVALIAVPLAVFLGYVVLKASP
eukprot:m.36496 g.36496  ORF g.36496 m.36496 type:complete len:225 (-) comp6677_c0_seq1:291-965(-)